MRHGRKQGHRHLKAGLDQYACSSNISPSVMPSPTRSPASIFHFFSNNCCDTDNDALILRIPEVFTRLLVRFGSLVRSLVFQIAGERLLTIRHVRPVSGIGLESARPAMQTSHDLARRWVRIATIASIDGLNGTMVLEEK